MGRIRALFNSKQNGILNIYFTAGYPGLNDTETIIRTLTEAGVDMIEVGMPYSDPMADGPTIQQKQLSGYQTGDDRKSAFSPGDQSQTTF